MKKEHLALALIIVCIIGSFIGLIASFNKAGSNSETAKTADGKSFASVLSAGKKMAIVRLNGVITDDEDEGGFLPSMSIASKAKKYIEKARDDKSVKGVILRINSPGGTVGTSQEIYNAVMECRKEKPVVVSMGDLAASGGYYIASASDVIYANPGTLTGSIGVIFNIMNFSELTNKWGIKSNTIKSGKFKDIGSPTRPMTDAEKALLQNIVNGTYEQFVNAIIKGRIKANINNKQVAKRLLTEKGLRDIADGRILTGEQAKKAGLVDELGGIEDAKVKLVELAQERFKNIPDNIRFENYDRAQTFGEMFLEMKNSLKPSAGIKEELPLSITHPNQPLWILEY